MNSCQRTWTFLVLKLFLVFYLLFALIACDSKPTSTLRIGTNTWPGYEPLYLARSLNYFDGYNIRLVEHSSASQVIRAFRNGAIDAAALTLDEVLLLLQSGFKPQLVLVMDVSDGGDVIIAQTDIKQFKGLQGKRIGVENTALGAYVLARALEIEGLSPTEINTVAVELNEHDSAFGKRTVDAVVTFEPVRSRLLSKGGQILFDSSQIPGEIVDVLVVSENYMAQHPQQIKGLVEQWFKAVTYLQSNPKQAVKYIGKRLKLEPEAVLGSFQGLHFPQRSENRQLLLGENGAPALLENADRLAQVMFEQKLLNKKVNATSLFSGVKNILN